MISTEWTFRKTCSVIIDYIQNIQRFNIITMYYCFLIRNPSHFSYSLLLVITSNLPLMTYSHINMSSIEWMKKIAGRHSDPNVIIHSLFWKNTNIEVRYLHKQSPKRLNQYASAKMCYHWNNIIYFALNCNLIPRKVGFRLMMHGIGK